MNPDLSLLLISLFGVVGLVSSSWLLRQATRTRLAIGIVVMTLFTAALWQSGVAPLRPPPVAIEGSRRFAFELLEVLWWFWLAHLLIDLGRAFLLIGHRERERKFTTDLLAGIVYVGACFAVTGLVLNLPITGLLATSGVIAIVLGLALQSTLSDVFSGIALNIEGAYRVGDWIALEGGAEGQVIEINWRATLIMTATRQSIVIPNSNLAKSRITNFSSPSQTQGVELSVCLDNRTPPSRGIELLEHAVLNCQKVLTDPAPKIRIKGFGTSSVVYQVRFFVERVDVDGQVKSDVLNFIYRHAGWAGISIADPQAGEEPTLRIGPTQKPALRKFVDRAPEFAHLQPAERDVVQQSLTRRAMKVGEVLLKQNSEVESLSIVESGVVSLLRKLEDGTTLEVDRRGPGEDFGAFSVFSGGPSSVTVTALTAGEIYELPKRVILSLLAARPELKSDLDRALATGAILPAYAEVTERPDLGVGAGVPANLFERIASLFSTKDRD